MRMYGLSIVCLRYKMIQNDHIIRFDLTGLLCSTLTTASLSFQQRPSNMGYPKCVTQKPSKLLSKAIKSQMSQFSQLKPPINPIFRVSHFLWLLVSLSFWSKNLSLPFSEMQKQIQNSSETPNFSSKSQNRLHHFSVAPCAPTPPKGPVVAFLQNDCDEGHPLRRS